MTTITQRIPTFDLVADILERIAGRHPLSATIARQVEADVRRDWGGQRVYIPKSCCMSSEANRLRDERIHAASRRGVAAAALAQRWGISTRRIQQILAARNLACDLAAVVERASL